MDRQTWFEARRATVEMLPAVSRDLVRSFQTLFSATDLPAATLITFVCVRYESVESLDVLTERVLHGHLFPAQTQPREILEKCVQPICRAYRERALPFNQWWDVCSIYLSFIQIYVSARCAKVGEPEIRGELRDRWHFPQPELIDTVLNLSSRYCPEHPWRLFDDNRGDKVDAKIAGVSRSGAIRYAVKKALAKCPRGSSNEMTW